MMPDPGVPWSLGRRDLLRGAAVVSGAAALGVRAGGAVAAQSTSHVRLIDFTGAVDGDGWSPDWASVGVANLRRAGGVGVLEAGSDIFPNDPMPVVFAVDHRARDGRVRAVLAVTGDVVGVVARRVSPRHHYAAVLDTRTWMLRILRRVDFELDQLASVPVSPLVAPNPSLGQTAAIWLEVSGTSETLLSAGLEGADGSTHIVAATDSTPTLQAAGDFGVLARAETLFPSTAPVLPALGNIRLAAYGVQEGQQVIGSPLGQVVIEEIRRRSTAAFLNIEINVIDTPRDSVPSVVASTTGTPTATGAQLWVAADLPCEVTIEVAATSTLDGADRIDVGETGAFESLTADVSGLPSGETVHWRPRLRRKGTEIVGEPRRFRVPPSPSDRGRAATMAVAACGSQFGPIFNRIAERRPDVLLWQGDLNYPDTHGPLAQTVAGYAGVWRHFLDNPRLTPVLRAACFVAQRDDHDFGVQDANAANLPPHGLAPWDALMNPDPYSTFPIGPLQVWVLDQRLHKSDPTAPDTLDKTLLGLDQRRWLLDSLEASTAPFKLICSPCTVASTPIVNERDGSWAAGFTSERELILDHVRQRVSGQTVFLTGDTHLTMAFDDGDLVEFRGCPVDIPRPNDITITDPLAAVELGSSPHVTYSADTNHVTLITAVIDENVAVLEVELMDQDGDVGHRSRFEQPVAADGSVVAAPSRPGPETPVTGAGAAAVGAAALASAEALRRSHARSARSD